ncbi:hypothetical protein B0T21DRAFT_415310 [Apiosordaria backusii]|uniref:Uncharacterized protein n=1 Tax=Apiosordaria backusii TaxID=314023 RepID=A0AA40AIQ4_9PEZI|nr:hypothetical protein B0T21DRAFT_415310 [Apiosordaria backusii]
MKPPTTSLTLLLAIGSPLALAAPVITPGAIEVATVPEHGYSIAVPRSPESLPLLRIAKPSNNRQNVVKNTLQTLNVQLNLLRVLVSLVKIICKLDNVLPIL